jgi:hypothetical protein
MQNPANFPKTSGPTLASPIMMDPIVAEPMVQLMLPYSFNK